MGIETEVTKNVFAERELIWELLEDTSTWTSWWTDCVAVKTQDGKPLREGSQLELVVRPKRTKMTLRPVVDLCTEGKTLSLTHRSAGIHSTCVWQLTDRPEGVRLSAQIVFNGFVPFLITIAQQSSVVRFSLNNNLKGLKRAAERRGLE